METSQKQNKWRKIIKAPVSVEKWRERRNLKTRRTNERKLKICDSRTVTNATGQKKTKQAAIPKKDRRAEESHKEITEVWIRSTRLFTELTKSKGNKSQHTQEAGK